MNTLEGFPDIPLIRIFDFLSPADQRSAKEVCKQWNSLLHLSRFMVRQTVYFKPDQHIDDLPPPAKDRFRNLVRATRNIAIHHTSYALLEGIAAEIISVKVIFDYQQISLAIFLNLREIHIERLCSINALPDSIEKIYLKYAHFGRESWDFQMIKNKPNLKVLIVRQMFLSWPSTPVVKVTPAVKLLMDLVSHNITIAPINLLHQALTLADMTGIDIIVPETSHNSTALLKQCKNLEALRLQNSCATGCFFVHDILDFEKVKVIHLFEFAEKFCTLCWQTLLSSCPNCKEYQLLNGVKVISLIDGLPHRTLETLIVCGPDEYSPMDHGLNVKDWSIFANLQSIHFDAIRFSESNVRELITKCPNIRSAEFVNCYFDGREREFGEEMLRNGWKYLEKLHLNVSYSRGSFEEGSFPKRRRILKTTKLCDFLK